MELQSTASFSHALVSLYLRSCAEHENSAVSPVSVFICMSMLNHGAKGATKDEISKALSLTSEDGGKDALAVIKHLKASNDSKFVLTTANALFSQLNFEALPDFVAHLKKYFDAHTQSVRFGTPAGEKVVNEWVESATNGKIKDLVRGTSEDTVLALINAVYMKGKWLHPFKKEATSEGDFVNGEKTLKVKYMQQTEMFHYIDKADRGFSIAFFGYHTDNRNNGWEMGILLPKEGRKPLEFLDSLHPSVIKQLRADSKMTRLNVMMPKTKIESKIDLIPFFKSLGVNLAFTGAADFSGIW